MVVGGFRCQISLLNTVLILSPTVLMVSKSTIFSFSSFDVLYISCISLNSIMQTLFKLQALRTFILPHDLKVDLCP